MKMLQISLGLGFELSALLIGATFLSPIVAEFMAWDSTMVLAFLVIMSLVVWLIHVVIFFNRKYKDS